MGVAFRLLMRMELVRSATWAAALLSAPTTSSSKACPATAAPIEANICRRERFIRNSCGVASLPIILLSDAQLRNVVVESAGGVHPTIGGGGGGSEGGDWGRLLFAEPWGIASLNRPANGCDPSRGRVAPAT